MSQKVPKWNVIWSNDNVKNKSPEHSTIKYSKSDIIASSIEEIGISSSSVKNPSKLSSIGTEKATNINAISGLKNLNDMKIGLLLSQFNSVKEIDEGPDDTIWTEKSLLFDISNQLG